MTATIMFVGLSLINVVLGTMRSILTIKSTRFVAACINAVSFTFYNVVVKMLTGYDMVTVAVVTFAANMAGVYIATWILAKAKKDKIWIFEAIIDDEIYCQNVFYDMNYVLLPIYNSNSFSLRIYARTQKESTTIIENFESEGIWYTAIESVVSK